MIYTTIITVVSIFITSLVTSAVASSSSIPPECNDYLMLNDSTRSQLHGYERYSDYLDEYASPDWEGEAWYRIIPPAGLVIPEISPGN